MDHAIEHLEKTIKGEKDSELTPLIKVLMGMMPPSPLNKLEDISFFDESLNPSQKEAIRFCLESPEVACIHGPPGTGKVSLDIVNHLARTYRVMPRPILSSRLFANYPPPPRNGSWSVAPLTFP